MANEFTLQDSGFFNEPSGFSFLQDPSVAQQFSLFGGDSSGSLLQDPSFTSSLGFNLGDTGGFGLDMFFDTQTGRVVSRQEAEQLSAPEMGGNPEAGLPQPGPTPPPTPGFGSKIMEALKANPLTALFLLSMGGLGLAGVGQQLAGGGGKKVTQKTTADQPTRTPLEENLLALANQVLMSGGTGIPSLGGGVASGGFAPPSAGASNAVLSALTGPRASEAVPAGYRQSLLKLLPGA